LLYLPRFSLTVPIKLQFSFVVQKDLGSGVPMAQILFIGQPLGMIVLPIMIFHQIQLMVCG
jgi:sodium/bile acid cotransporter 7